jgi:calcium-dependent protein kinase
MWFDDSNMNEFIKIS